MLLLSREVSGEAVKEFPPFSATFICLSLIIGAVSSHVLLSVKLARMNDFIRKHRWKLLPLPNFPISFHAISVNTNSNFRISTSGALPLSAF